MLLLKQYITKKLIIHVINYKTNVKEHFHFIGGCSHFWTHHSDLEGHGPYLFLELWSIDGVLSHSMLSRARMLCALMLPVTNVTVYKK
jgi:hypothetical protein